MQISFTGDSPIKGRVKKGRCLYGSMLVFFFFFYLNYISTSQISNVAKRKEWWEYCTRGSRYAHNKVYKAPHSTHSCTEIFAQKMWKVHKCVTDSPINKQKCYFVIQSPTGSLRSLHKLIVSINIIT